MPTLCNILAKRSDDNSLIIFATALHIRYYLDLLYLLMKRVCSSIHQQLKSKTNLILMNIFFPLLNFISCYCMKVNKKSA